MILKFRKRRRIEGNKEIMNAIKGRKYQIKKTKKNDHWFPVISTYYKKTA